ncbi:hypothetical protein GGU11DRAFT_746386 [Lentinula aff. detonsa]|nr:hypothetical protein GGU11DRAFT_746386 [Lentinula aff. detonsa]
MPFIHNEQTYAALENIRPLGEHAYTQDSGDLMAPTLPLPQGQISNEDIAIITLTAILILICGTAAIRLAHLVYYKKDASPRVVSCKTFTESSSTLPLTSTSTTRVSSSMKFIGPDDMDDFSDYPNEKIEQDITFSFPFARSETPPCPPRRPPAFLREEEEDIAAMLSIRAGQESACRRGHKEKKESESSLTTTSTAQDSLCPSEPRSSVTSVYSISIRSEDEEEEEDIEEVEIYEVKRAQTQSMEVKRGVLMSWRTSRPPSFVPDMPTVIISESSSDTGALNTVISGDEGFLQPLPSLLVTQPSNVSLVSTTSTVSVDLDEFPLPPSLPPLPKTQAMDLPLMLVVPDASGPQILRMSREEKRSTVDQVITLYEGH